MASNTVSCGSLPHRPFFGSNGWLDGSMVQPRRRQIQQRVAKMQKNHKTPATPAATAATPATPGAPQASKRKMFFSPGIRFDDLGEKLVDV